MADSEQSFKKVNDIPIIDHIFDNLKRISTDDDMAINYNLDYFEVMLSIAGSWSRTRNYVLDRWPINDFCPEIASLEIVSPAIQEAVASDFITEKDQYFYVIKANFFLPPDDWDRVFYQHVLNYPVVYVSLERYRHVVVFTDERDSSLKNIVTKPIMYVDTGIYKLPFSICQYVKERNDVLEGCLDYIKEERLKWAMSQKQKKVTTPSVMVYPLKGWQQV